MALALSAECLAAPLASGSLTSSNSPVLQGNFETLTYGITGGNTPFAYNFLVTNALNGNTVFYSKASNALTTNSVTFKLRRSNNIRGVIAGPTSYPLGITLNPTNTLLYVVNSKNSTVSVLDTATNALVNVIMVGNTPQDILFDQANGGLYVTNNGGNTVSVINSITNTVVNTIGGFASPWGLKLDPLTNAVYVANGGRSTLSVIGTATNSIVNTIGVGAIPSKLAFSPTYGTVYVSNYGSNTVSVINTITNSVVNTVGGILHPLGIVFDPANNDVYVVNVDFTSVAVINTVTNSIDNTIGLGSGHTAQDIGFNPSNNQIYVSTFNTGNILAINTITNTVVNTIGMQALDNANEIVFDQSTGTAYVAAKQGIGMVNTLTNSVSGIIPAFTTFSSYPSMAFALTVNAMYMTNGGTPGSVDAIDSLDRVTGHIGRLDDPEGIAFDSANGKLYVADYGSSTVSVIDPSTNTVVNTIPGFTTPTAVLFAANSIYVYNSYIVSVVNTMTNSISTTISGFNNGNVDMAVNPANNDIYVASTCASTNNDLIAVVDPSTDTITKNIVGMDCPGWLSFSKATGALYVPNTGNDLISIVNVISGETTNAVATAYNPWFSSLDNATNTVYVATSECGGEDVLYAINITTERETDNLSLGTACPEYAQYSPAANEVYVEYNSNATVGAVNAGPYYDNLGTLDVSANVIDNTGGFSSITNTIKVMAASAKTALTATITGNPGFAGYYTLVTLMFNGTATTNNQSAWSLFVDGILFGKTASIINWTEQASPGTYSFTFSNPGNANYTNYTLGTTLKVGGLGTGGGVGGGSQSSVTSTVSSTTVTTTAGSTSVSTTTIAQVNATGTNHTIRVNATTPVTVNFHNVGVSITIHTNSTGGTTISVSVTDATLKSPAPPVNLTKLAAYNITVNGSASSVVAELPYQCTAGSSSLRPYILRNGTWVALQQFSVNSAGCSVTVTVPKDPVVAIMQNQTVRATTTTVPTAPVSKGNGTATAVAAVAITIVVIVAAALWIRKRRRGWPPYRGMNSV